jgi:hypothetical protein
MFLKTPMNLFFKLLTDLNGQIVIRKAVEEQYRELLALKWRKTKCLGIDFRCNAHRYISFISKLYHLGPRDLQVGKTHSSVTQPSLAVLTFLMYL